MYKLIFIVIFNLLFLVGCNFNEDSGAAPETKRSVDMAYSAIGISYVCSSGVVAYTDSNGVFSCNESDNVTFYLGSTKVTTLSKDGSLITPYDLFNNDNEAALNYVRLLNALNKTEDANGTIVLNQEDLQKLPADLDFSSYDFEDIVESALLKNLISTTEAQESLNEAVIAAGGTIPKGSNQPVGVISSNKIDTLVTLNALQSSDLDNDVLTYKWTLLESPSGSTATLNSTSNVLVTFNVDKVGSYIVGLIVNDSNVDSKLVKKEIVVSSSESLPPIAKAGDDQSTLINTEVTLDATESSAQNGDTLNFLWSINSQPTDSNIALSDSTISKPTFTPTFVGDYTFDVNVSNINGSSVDSVVIHVGSGNVKPVANAGEDQNVLTPTVVQLSGISSSDANGDSLTYKWTIVSQPAGSTIVLNDNTIVNPTFTVNIDGDYKLSLVVNDGTLDSDNLATVTVRSSTANIAPVANAGSNYPEVSVDTQVTLDGSGSSDANGDTLTYAWTISAPSGSTTAALNNVTIVSPSFTPDIDGTYTLQLVVNDGSLNSDTSTVVITVNPININSKPTANAGPDGTAYQNEAYQLDGSDSFDSDNDTITYQWSITSGQSGSFSSNTAQNPTFTPAESGSYIISLVVNDGNLNSTTASMVLTSIATERLKKTGQTITYSASDDGAYSIGAERTYTIVGQTITDEATSLTWHNIDVGTKSLSDANSYCLALDTDGINNWRLPTEKELLTLANFEKTDPAFDSELSNAGGNDYWTSTLYDDNFKVVIDFYNTETIKSATTETTGSFIKKTVDILREVRCVSGTAIANNFERDNTNSIVIDNVHKLMWQDDAPSTPVVWDSAISYCENLDYATYTDWRLPNIVELISAVDFQNPSTIFNAYFVNNVIEAWSSTTSSYITTTTTGFIIKKYTYSQDHAFIVKNGTKEPGVMSSEGEKAVSTYAPRCVRGF